MGMYVKINSKVCLDTQLDEVTRRIILVAPMVKRVPSSILRRSRGCSSTLSTKVPVLLLLSLRV